MHLTIDFESRSPEKIEYGPWKYWEHRHSEPVMCAMKVDDLLPRIWLPAWLLDRYPALEMIFDVISDEERDHLTQTAETIEAHNAMFERAGWELKMVPTGAAPIDVKKWRCSAANAARFKLPRGLEDLCVALGITEQKDSAGHELMKKMCAPIGYEEGAPFYRESLEDFVAEVEYCLQDVQAEHAASVALPKMPKRDLKTWQLDQEINARGVAVDLRSLGRVVEHRGRHFAPLRERFADLTGGLRPTQDKKFKAWSEKQGVEMPDMRADTVEIFMVDPMVPENVREALLIRSTVGKSSLAKIDKILESVCADGRVRDILMYHGAGPGRWTGKGIQVHNFPKKSAPDVEDIIRDLYMNATLFEMVHGPFGLAMVECLRGFLIADDGRTFMNGDFSSVEARWVAWICQDEMAMEIFRTHGKVYEAAAAGIFGCHIEDILKESVERQIGKVCELALGFGGGVKAFISMGRTQKLDLRIVVSAVMPTASDEEVEYSTKIVGMMFSDKLLKELRVTREIAIACDIVKSRWRKSRTAVTNAWYALEDCAFKAVQNPGALYQWHGIYFGVQGKFLCMRLPSGRSIYYYKPEIKEVTPPWVDKSLPEEMKEKKKVVTYLCAKGKNGLKREGMYGGKWLENMSQGGCTDLLSTAMLKLEEAGYTVGFTVQDEINGEIPVGFGNHEEFISIMEELPPWAIGFPLKSDGWTGPRFRK